MYFLVRMFCKKGIPSRSTTDRTCNILDLIFHYFWRVFRGERLSFDRRSSPGHTLTFLVDSHAYRGEILRNFSQKVKKFKKIQTVRHF